jgi:Na+/melibiose symporter-like transporter
VALIYFALTCAYSLFAVPFVSTPAEISPEPAERERVNAWRIGFAMVGVLIGAGLAPILVELGGGGRAGYLFMALIVGAFCGAGMMSAFLATPSRLGGAPAVVAAKGAPTRPTVWADRRLLRLILAYVIQLTGVGLVSAIAPYWIVQVAGRTQSQVGLALGCLLLVTIAATPLWAVMIRRKGARAASAWAAFLYGLSTLGFLVLPAHADTLPTFCLFALVGAPFAGVQIAPFALAAHLIHDAAAQSGARSEGLLTGFWTAGEKLGLALGPGAAGLGLMVIGFHSGAARQTAQALMGVNLLMALGPPTFLWLSLIFLIEPRSA